MKNSPRQIIHRALRFGCINGKYRDQIDFSFEKLEQNIATLKNIDEVCKKVSRYDTELSGVRRDFREYMQDIMARHIEALEDDFSFPESFAVFFEFVKYIREQIAAEEFSQEELQSCIDMLLSFDQVYGILDLSLFEEEEDIPEEIITLASQRQEAKDAKNYTRADEIRNELTLLGYVVKDTKEGSIVERI